MIFVIDWENSKILHNESNQQKRLFAKMFFIKKQGKNVLNNMTDCEKLPESCDVLINKI